MAEPPICNKCGQAHWRFKKCEPELPSVEEYEQSKSEPVPPGSLKPWGAPHPNSDQFGPPVN